MTNLTNRPFRKGVEINTNENLLKITVNKHNEKDITIGGLAEYYIRYEKDRYCPAKEYN